MLLRVESPILMSAHKLQLILTEPAKQDFRDILSFTLQTWGEGQFDEYRRKLDGALHTIAENPDIGHKRHGMLVYQAGRHRIFYREQGTSIYIFRILHERMDAGRHLD